MWTHPPCAGSISQIAALQSSAPLVLSSAHLCSIGWLLWPRPLQYAPPLQSAAAAMTSFWGHRIMRWYVLHRVHVISQVTSRPIQDKKKLTLTRAQYSVRPAGGINPWSITDYQPVTEESASYKYHNNTRWRHCPHSEPHRESVHF